MVPNGDVAERSYAPIEEGDLRVDDGSTHQAVVSARRDGQTRSTMSLLLDPFFDCC